ALCDGRSAGRVDARGDTDDVALAWGDGGDGGFRDRTGHRGQAGGGRTHHCDSRSANHDEDVPNSSTQRFYPFTLPDSKVKFNESIWGGAPDKPLLHVGTGLAHRRD